MPELTQLKTPNIKKTRRLKLSIPFSWELKDQPSLYMKPKRILLDSLPSTQRKCWTKRKSTRRDVSKFKTSINNGYCAPKMTQSSKSSSVLLINKWVKNVKMMMEKRRHPKRKFYNHWWLFHYQVLIVLLTGTTISTEWTGFANVTKD